MDAGFAIECAFEAKKCITQPQKGGLRANRLARAAKSAIIGPCTRKERDDQVLKIDHLTKRYGDKEAVKDLSLHIKPGEIYGFIGHNGAGKTTTIKSCAGILAFEEDQYLLS